MSSDDPNQHDFGTKGLAARVTAQGAELCSLQDVTGRDYLWSAGPVWPRHAPVLFPIVGRLRDDTLVHRGRSYRMTQHGFARDRRFTWVERSATGCVLALTEDAHTRAMYPFAFRLEISYAVSGTTLDVTYTVTNTGDEILPASMGAHPAFRWPLVRSVPKERYSLTFEADEPEPLRGVVGGLLTEADRPSPIVDRTLALNEELFAKDALILPKPASRQVRLAASDWPYLTVSWEGFSQLGLWSRAGGDFLCIEPWCGMASPAGFAGEFTEKPWLMLIPPGDSRTAVYRIAVD